MRNAHHVSLEPDGPQVDLAFPNSSRQEPIKRRVHPKLEELEDRIAPADLTVTNLSGNASTVGSLPYEVSIAKTGQSIGFAAGLNGTIGLGSEIQLGQNSVNNLTIDGTGATITISGQHQTRIFEILQGTTATINNLTLTDGYTWLSTNANGAAILVDSGAHLNLTGDTFTSNQAAAESLTGSGGAVANSGTVNINGGNTFTSNTAQANGGAIYNANVLNINGTAASNVAFNNNSAGQNGGAIYSDSGSGAGGGGGGGSGGGGTGSSGGGGSGSGGGGSGSSGSGSGSGSGSSGSGSGSGGSGSSGSGSGSGSGSSGSGSGGGGSGSSGSGSGGGGSGSSGSGSGGSGGGSGSGGGGSGSSGSGSGSGSGGSGSSGGGSGSGGGGSGSSGSGSGSGSGGGSGSGSGTGGGGGGGSSGGGGVGYTTSYTGSKIGSTFFGTSSSGSGMGANAQGAGLYTTTSSVTVANSNSSSNGAAGVAGSVSVNYATFQNNTAQKGNGGAIATMDPLTVNNSSFLGNTANAGNGGAIDTSNNTFITKDVFLFNSASGNGGAIDNETTVVLTVQDSGFGSNTAGQNGGAIANFGTLNVALVKGVNPNWYLPSPNVAWTDVMFVANTAQKDGGAIYSNAAGNGNTGGLSVSSSYWAPVAFYANAATTGSGGAIYTGDDAVIFGARFGDLTVKNVAPNKDELTVLGNIAARSGGAINATGGSNGTQTLTVTKSVFWANEARALGAEGGAIHTSATTDVEQSYFYFNDNEAIMPNNVVLSDGGAIAYDISSDQNGANSSLTLNLDSFKQNQGVAGGAVTSGVVVSAGQITVKVSNSTFFENRAGAAGGGLSISHTTSENEDLGTKGSASVTLINDTFFQNISDGAGGGISIALTADNSTSNTVSLTSLTVFANLAVTSGGGLDVATGQVSVNNSIFDGNTVSSDPGLTGPQDVGLAAGASLNDLGFNLVGTTDTMFNAASDILNDNPGLANSLNWNGAPINDPMTLALSTTSPGYETGDPSLQYTTDERGYIRIKAVSIGAEDPDATPPS